MHYSSWKSGFLVEFLDQLMSKVQSLFFDCFNFSSNIVISERYDYDTLGSLVASLYLLMPKVQ